ncbi:phosphotransferase [Citricoccus muralis]|uniref:Phosphotransferase n=1 Tax=Citricoccus muralis TaxID=169134 RepID=A0ABY8H4R0_9MICC|nr:phosphotransferase [Citricoccus muralis]WFP15663.1 phosphotransferase [Citricoccus muralis]
MNRSPMELAALASAAVPGLSPVSVAAAPDSARDFDSAVVTDREDQRWRIRSPKHEKAAFRLETELQVLSGFTPAIRAKLPFRAPSVAGAVQLDGLRTFVYHNMPGSEIGLDGLVAASEPLPQDIGRVTAAIHQLSDAVVEAANLPVYTADEFRSRRLNELDQAALTGAIPSVLLRRWEAALEETSLWSFQPRVVHGDLHEDNLLVERGRVVGVTGWTDLHWGDPATDFAWLASVEEPAFVEKIIESYRSHMKGGTDENLMRRASLAAEFALAQWMVQGISTHDEQIQGEAATLLEELAEDVRDHGGQDIGVASHPAPTPVPEPEPTPDPESKAPETEKEPDDAPKVALVEDAPEVPEEPEEPADEDVTEEDDDGAVITDSGARPADEPEQPAEPDNAVNLETAPIPLEQLRAMHQRRDNEEHDSRES